MPDTLLQLKISSELHDRARLKMERIQRAHEDEVDALVDKIKAATPKEAEKLEAKWEALHDRGRRITILNTVRVAIDIGLSDLSDADALKWIAKEGVPLGRPRRIAG